MTKRRKSNTNKMPWFKFFTADFVTAVMNLSGVERGIYVDLLRLFWEYGSLPDDLDKIRVKMLPTGERHHSRIYKWIRTVLEQCFQQADDGSWFYPGFGDHHLSVPKSDKLVPKSDKLVEWEGVLSNDINVPCPQEQNRAEQNTHTRAGVCGNGKDKQADPALDSSDDDPEIMEMFRAIADKDLPSRYRSPSPDGGLTNGHGPNGHDPTSPATDLDRAVAVYLAGFTSRGHPKRASEEDVVEIRQELAEILEKDPIEVVMAAMDYHMTEVWFRKEPAKRSSPLGFLKNKTWGKDTPEHILTAAREDHRRRQERQESMDRQTPADLKPENWDEISAQFMMDDDDGCDDGSNRDFG